MNKVSQQLLAKRTPKARIAGAAKDETPTALSPYALFLCALSEKYATGTPPASLPTLSVDRTVLKSVAFEERGRICGQLWRSLPQQKRDAFSKAAFALGSRKEWLVSDGNRTSQSPIFPSPLPALTEEVLPKSKPSSLPFSRFASKYWATVPDVLSPQDKLRVLHEQFTMVKTKQSKRANKKSSQVAAGKVDTQSFSSEHHSPPTQGT